MENENVLHSIPSLKVNIIEEALIPDNFLRDIHFHKEIELVQVTHGKILCTIGNEVLELDETQTLFINSRVFHQLSYCGISGELTYIQIDIREHFSKLFPDFNDYTYWSVLNNFSKQYFLFDHTSQMRDLFEKIKIEGLRKDIYYNVTLKAYIHLLIIYMLRSDMLVHPSVFKDSKMVNRLLPALEYTDQNFLSKISLEDVCTYANMDKFNFCKLFKQVTGITFVEYLNLRRILYAEELLINSDKSITEIAFESGFMSIQYFNKVFKKNLNCLPSAYRKAYAAVDYITE